MYVSTFMAFRNIIVITYPWSVCRCPANCESAAILWSCCFTVHASIFCRQSATARSKPSTMLSDWRVSSSATSSSARNNAVSMINSRSTSSRRKCISTSRDLCADNSTSSFRRCSAASANLSVAANETVGAFVEPPSLESAANGDERSHIVVVCHEGGGDDLRNVECNDCCCICCCGRSDDFNERFSAVVGDVLKPASTLSWPLC